jgi:hypothetical protein
MFPDSLNRSISEISSIMQTCDISKITDRLEQLVSAHFQDHEDLIEETPPHTWGRLNDCCIFSHMVAMKHAPLNDRLSLPHRIFVALDKI